MLQTFLKSLSNYGKYMKFLSGYQLMYHKYKHAQPLDLKNFQFCSRKITPSIYLFIITHYIYTYLFIYLYVQGVQKICLRISREDWVVFFNTFFE